MGSLLLLLGAVALASPWPAESRWEPVTRGGQPLATPCPQDAEPGWWHITGSPEAPAAFTWFDGQHLHFRLRLGGRPVTDSQAGTPDWRHLGIGVLIESEWDPSRPTHDWLLHLDGATETVSLWAFGSDRGPLWNDAPDTLVASWAAPASQGGDGAARYALADTRLCPDGHGDWFVELRLPWAVLQTWSGVPHPAWLGFAFTTSTHPGTNLLDVAGCALAEGSCGDWWEVVSDTRAESPDVDSDGDGLSDHDEIHIYGTDPFLPDTDGDGLLDGQEVLVFGTDPLKWDTDRDGLSDGDEVVRHRTDPLLADSDGGGVPDGAEVLAGTNPLDPRDDHRFGLANADRHYAGGGGSGACALAAGAVGAWWSVVLGFVLGGFRRRNS